MKPIYLAHACSGYRLAYGASSPLYHLPAPAEGSQIPIISSKRFPKNGTMVDHRDWIELANDFPREIIPNPERSSMAVSPRPEVTGTSARKWSDVTSTVTAYPRFPSSTGASLFRVCFGLNERAATRRLAPCRLRSIRERETAARPVSHCRHRRNRRGSIPVPPFAQTSRGVSKSSGDG